MAEFLQLNPETTTRGLGVVTGAIFLSGEMAGSGVLALPMLFWVLDGLV